MSDTKV